MLPPAFDFSVLNVPNAGTLFESIASFINVPWIWFLLPLFASMKLTPELVKAFRKTMDVTIVNVRGMPANKQSVGGRWLRYIARRVGAWESSPLGNPFKIGRDGDRATVIEKYRAWLRGEVARGEQYAAGVGVAPSPAYNEIKNIARDVERGESLALGCWCYPDECHGDVVADALAYVCLRTQEQRDLDEGKI